MFFCSASIRYYNCCVAATAEYFDTDVAMDVNVVVAIVPAVAAPHKVLIGSFLQAQRTCVTKSSHPMA